MKAVRLDYGAGLNAILSEKGLVVSSKKETIVLRFSDGQRMQLRPAKRSWRLLGAIKLQPAAPAGKLRKLRGDDYELRLAGETIRIRVARNVAAPLKARKALWSALLPGAPGDLASLGVPAEVSLGRKARLTLLGSAAVEEPSFGLQPPKGWSTGKSKPASLPAPSEPAGGLPRRLERVAPVRGGDFRWLFGQDFLDELQGIANKFSNAIGSIHGEANGGDAHVMLKPLDLLGRLGGPNRQNLIDTIAYLVLFWRVWKNIEPVGLTAAETRAYRRNAAGCGSMRSSAVCRLGAFLNYTGARLRAVAFAQLFDLLKERKASFGFRAKNFHGVADLINLRISDIDVHFDFRDLIEELYLEDGAIHVKLAIDRFSLRFHYRSEAMISHASMVANILTLGRALLVQYNEGYAKIYKNDVAMHLQLRPERDPVDGKWKLRLDASRRWLRTPTLEIINGNPVEEFIEWISPTLGDWALETSRKEMRAGLENALNELLDVEFLNWLDIWSATQPPDQEPRIVSITPRSASYVGDLANSALPAERPQDFSNELGQCGYSFSQRYLSEWLKERTGWISDPVPADIPGAVGVALPAPRPLAEVRPQTSGPCSYPELPPATAANRSQLTRGLPAVVVSGQGWSSRAGTLELRYSLLVDEQVSRFRAELEDPETCSWRIFRRASQETVYLRAAVVVRCGVWVDFNPSGAMWLPEARLSLDGRFRSQVESLAADAPFDAPPRASLEQALRDLCERDAAALFRSKNLIFRAPVLVWDPVSRALPGSIVNLLSGLFPGFQPGNQLSNLFGWRQETRVSASRYFIRGTNVFWPWKLQQTLSDRIR